MPLFLRIVRRLAALTAAALLAGAAAAQILDAPDQLSAAQEARYLALAEQLRCMVCQNQSLADSNADLAADMRAAVRRQLAAGASDDEILAFMHARFGDFVLYKPPVRAGTAALWLLPFAALIGGLAAVAAATKRRKKTPALAAEQRARARELLGE